jgi:hypothetical protein
MSGYFVYAIECDGNIKVGVARDPVKRLATLQTGSASKLRLIHQRDFEWREQAHRAEAGVHDELRGQHVNGEWFRRRPIDPIEVIDIYHTEHRLIVASRLAMV